MTPLPVFGVPVESKALSGQDSLLVDRADASRHPGRHAGHRQAPAPSTPHCSPPPCWRSATKRLPSASTPGAPHRRRRSPNSPRTRHDAPRCQPARRSASSAAASSAACWRWPPPGSATARWSSSRRAIAPPRRSPTGRSSPPMTTPTALAELAREMRRRHLRVRERAGGCGSRAFGRHVRCFRREGAGGQPGPRWSKNRSSTASEYPQRTFGRGQRPAADRCPEGICGRRHPEDAPHGL